MSGFDWVRDWVETSPYCGLLGLRVEEISEGEARLALPFKEALSNGDTALHGGVAGSVIVTTAGCAARAALGPDSGPWHTSAAQVSYLSAALGEGLTGTGRVLRKGKELAHVEVDVTAEGGKPVAKGLLAVRGRFAAGAAGLPVTAGFGSGSDPGPMGPFIGSIPFHSTLGISADHMAGGLSRIVMPENASNTTPDGWIHEGAILALVDTTGAMAAWAETGPGRFKASTPGLQARVLDAEPRGGLVGHGRMVYADRELLFCDVEICRAADGRLVADGSVNYRIVRPDPQGN
jgi:uncharacterized protein (TIGR00369 family)